MFAHNHINRKHISNKLLNRKKYECFSDNYANRNKVSKLK